MKSLSPRQKALAIAVLAGLWLLFLVRAAGAQAATVNVSGTGFSMQWTAASGPVAVYEVWVSRNGGQVQRELDVTGLVTAVNGKVGDSIYLQVRACDAGKANCGPFSVASDTVVLGQFAIGTPSKATVIVTCTDPTKPAAYIRPDGVPDCK